MDLIEVSGSHYEIGFQIGQATAGQIAAVLSPKPLTPGFQKRVAVLAPLHERAFPHLLKEIQGMADGSGQEFEKLLAWNFFEQAGCTSILALGPGGFLAHNEDGNPVFRNHLSLVKMRIPRGQTIISLQYPGELGGNAVSVNSEGLVFSVNFIGPERLANVGYSANFLARELLGARNLGEVRGILAGCRPRADVYHWFVYSCSEGKALSIELLKDRESIQEFREGLHFHTNHCLNPDSGNEPQGEDESSVARLGRLPRFFRG
ncbi:MAG: C45 family peptidase [Patescibacteria group bacterium]